jgi:hypothetical protein
MRRTATIQLADKSRQWRFVKQVDEIVHWPLIAGQVDRTALNREVDIRSVAQ